MRSVTSVAPAKTKRRSWDSAYDPWAEQELAASRFKDVRLAKRCKRKRHAERLYRLKS